MTTHQQDVLLPDAGRIGSRMSRLSPDIFKNQADPESTETEKELEETEENVFSDEPVDDNGDPTGEDDH